MTKSLEFNDRIKFLLKDANVTNDYAAVCELYTDSIQKAVIPQQTMTLPTAANAKKSIYKKHNTIPVKITFDPEFYEKTVILPTINEKMKILAINHNFERMLRHNIIECMNKISKIEGDKENIKQEFEEFYTNQFLDSFIADLASSINKERLEFNISPPAVVTESQQ